MADNATSKIDAAAEKAFAEAAAKNVSAAKVEKAVEADPKPPVKTDAVAKAVATPAKKAPAKKVAAKKPAAKKAATKPAAKKAPAKKVAAKTAPKKAVAASKAAPVTSTVSKIKDTIMATDTTKITEAAKTFAADAQTRLKGAYTKGSELAGEVVEFNKANLEAVVASGKVLAAGMQTMAREGFEESKKAAEVVTADVKALTAVKSPTELVKLQGELARRNFDAAVAFGSKSTEAWLKLANEAFAPISTRYSEAAEKFSKAA
ncbi:phasin family protein [Erythrobacter sp. SDW2]|uniref:phasin family protein n=1 Tax=Erythrobacter sp. SDW2 TaxID=2907154 RepID=UPI001F160A54|nr:phasin family protein [Erythrobacter sp. SDW2]UIP06749.1 phasin family protein [Erythrobacter sp. SDW2]